LRCSRVTLLELESLRARLRHHRQLKSWEPLANELPLEREEDKIFGHCRTALPQKIGISAGRCNYTLV
jgi:hypothetical protein